MIWRQPWQGKWTTTFEDSSNMYNVQQVYKCGQNLYVFFSSVHLSEAVLCKLYKEQNRPIAKTILVAFSKATKLHSTISPSNNSVLISGVKSLEFGLTCWNHVSLDNSSALSPYPTIQLFILAFSRFSSYTKGLRVPAAGSYHNSNCEPGWTPGGMVKVTWCPSGTVTDNPCPLLTPAGTMICRTCPGFTGAEASGMEVEGNVWIPSTWRNWRSFKHQRPRLLGSFNTRFSHLSNPWRRSSSFGPSQLKRCLGGKSESIRDLGEMRCRVSFKVSKSLYRFSTR